MRFPLFYFKCVIVFFFLPYHRLCSYPEFYWIYLARRLKMSSLIDFCFMNLLLAATGNRQVVSCQGCCDGSKQLYFPISLVFRFGVKVAGRERKVSNHFTNLTFVLFYSCVFPKCRDNRTIYVLGQYSFIGNYSAEVNNRMLILCQI